MNPDDGGELEGEGQTSSKTGNNTRWTPNPQLKAKLLEHYSLAEPKKFLQIDAHDIGCDLGADDVFLPDPDGFCVLGGPRFELMVGCAVRVLIDPAADRARVALGLKKILMAVESGWVSTWEAYAGPGLLISRLTGPGEATR